MLFRSHAAQAVGRRVVSEQRALRRANPNRNNLRNAPGQRQNGPQRQNNLQRPNGPQQPVAPELRQGGLPKGPAAGLPKRGPLAGKKPPKERR